MKPSEKSEGIEEMITAVMGKDRRAVIMSGGCMTCDQGLRCRTCNQAQDGHLSTPHIPSTKGHPFMPFRDQLSAKEYSISGMCQTCQDSVFGTEEPEQDFL